MYAVILLVIIVDPGIKVDHGYRSYDNGMDMGVFIRVCYQYTSADYVHNISNKKIKEQVGINLCYRK